MAHCCVPQCSNNGRNLRNKDVRFHRFPRDPELRKQWIANIRREPGPTFSIKPRTVVCSEHFTPEDYGPLFGFNLSIRLLKEAVPTVFQWTRKELAKRKPHDKSTGTDDTIDEDCCELNFRDRVLSELKLKGVAYNTNLSDALYQLQQSGCLCDVTISTMTDKIPIHRVVFVSMVTPLCTRKGGIDKIMYKFKDLCRNYENDVVLAFVKYMYTGKIEVKTELMKDFLGLCKLLDVETSFKIVPNNSQRTGSQVPHSNNVSIRDTELNKRSSSHHTGNETSSCLSMHIIDSSAKPNENFSSEIKQEFNETENDENCAMDTGNFDSSKPCVKIEYVGDDYETYNAQVLRLQGQGYLNEENESSSCTTMHTESTALKVEHVVQEEYQNSDVIVSQSSLVIEENDKNGLDKCSICDNYIKTNEMSQHMDKQHKQKCPLCDWTGYDPQLYLNHILEQHNDPHPGKRSLQVKNCEYEGCSFRTASILHLREHQTKHGKPYAVCDLCEKNFDTHIEYKQHVSSHKNDKTTVCEKCHVEYKDQSKGHKCVKQKIKRNTKKKQRCSSGEINACNESPYKSNRKDTLNWHTYAKDGGLAPFMLSKEQNIAVFNASNSPNEDMEEEGNRDTSVQTHFDYSKEEMATTVTTEMMPQVVDLHLQKISPSYELGTTVHNGKVVIESVETDTYFSSKHLISSFPEDSLNSPSFMENDRSLSILDDTSLGHSVVITENSYLSISPGTE